MTVQTIKPGISHIGKDSRRRRTDGEDCTARAGGEERCGREAAPIIAVNRLRADDRSLPIRSGGRGASAELPAPGGGERPHGDHAHERRDGHGVGGEDPEEPVAGAG